MRVQTNLYALIEMRPDHWNFGKPFYIGIGNKKRPRQHLTAVKSKDGHYNAALHRIFQKHIDLGLEPEIKILATCPTREAACMLEIMLIAQYGRRGTEPNGTLVNITKGGDGGDSELMNSPEMKAKLSTRTKSALHEPTIRARHIEALEKVNATFTTERRSAVQSKKSPEAKARSTAALMAIHADPVIQAKRAENSREPQKKAWADPEKRAKRIAGLQGNKKTMTPAALEARRANAQKSRTPEANAKKSAAALAMWEKPAHREKRSRNQAAAWEDPEKRANMLKGRSKGISNSWNDPETRARRIAGIKAAAAAKVSKSE